MRKDRRLVYGIGVNDADYNVNVHEMTEGKWKKIWCCPHYGTWSDMLRRCYSEKYQSRQPTYKGCSVCEEWLTFSKFKAWMEQQDWEGKQLDKDLLKVGNKCYCPEWCIFVDRKINNFVTDSGASRGEYMIGVSWNSERGKFITNCGNPFTGKQEHVGRFTNELEAHLAWKKRKRELACMLAESEYCNDPRLAEALRTRYL